MFVIFIIWYIMGPVSIVHPLAVRQLRSELTEEAHRVGIEVFAQNLSSLLLTPPVRGKTVMAIDPGYSHGCKVAVVHSNGTVLKTDVFYLHGNADKYNIAYSIKNMLGECSCELIALGNGTACRETEMFLSEFIHRGFFKPLDVQYTIIDEQGASIYSCSPVAKKEFPDMDPNLISAVSLARRLQDPLSELVKVEPKHLGVGMYQHDVPEKKLSSTLNEVVVECVSFVGVDINTASENLLRFVAGLNATRAANIIKWRSSRGPIINRDQLLLIKGVGNKTFEQCAGFVRIIPKTCTEFLTKIEKGSTSEETPSKKSKCGTETTPNPLDQTCIHPESYAVTYRFIDMSGTSLQEFGSKKFIDAIHGTCMKIGRADLAVKLGISESQMSLIADALLQNVDIDYRSKFKEPLFRRGVMTLQDLKCGDKLTGRVSNVTHFGSFVDIGVGRSGLIHVSKMGNMQTRLGDRVEVQINSIDLQRERISLTLLSIL